MRPKHIIIHCSATPPSMDIGKAEIDEWHRQRGFSMVGYHWVIRRNGVMEKGREENEIGAHCKDDGMNRKSIGICYVGGVDANNNPEDNRTEDQKVMMFSAVKGLIERHRIESVMGHRDVKGVNKDCPCFDVDAWMRDCGLGCLVCGKPVDHRPKDEGGARHGSELADGKHWVCGKDCYQKTLEGA